MKADSKQAFVPHLSLVMVFVLHFLFTSEYWSMFVQINDEAVTVLGADRLLRGELPYRDWGTRHTPGSYFIAAAFFSLFGHAAPWTRVLFSLVSATTAVGLQLLSNRLLSGPYRFVPAFLFTSCGVMAFPVLSYHWMGTCILVWTVYALLRWAQDRSQAAAMVVGAGVALAGWTLQSTAAITGLLALSVALRLRPPGAARALATFAALSLLLWLPLLPYWREIFAENVLAMRLHLDFNYQPFSLAYTQQDLAALPEFAPNTQWRHVLALASDTAAQHVIYLTIYPLAVLGIVLFERRRQPARALGAWATLLALLVTHRQQTPMYVAFLSPLWALLICQMALQLAWRRLLFSTLLVLEGLGWVGRWDLRRQSFVFPIQTRSGNYFTNLEIEAARMQHVAEWLRAVPPRTPVFAYPFFTSAYTLFDLANPIREPVLQPLLYSPEVNERAAQTLEAKKVPWLLLQSRDHPLGAPGSNSDRVGREWDLRIAQFTRNYQQVAGFGNTGLFRRIPDR